MTCKTLLEAESLKLLDIQQLETTPQENSEAGQKHY